MGIGEGGRGGRREGEKERRSHTDLIHLNNVEFGAQVGKERLGGVAVGAVGFGEDGCCFSSRWLVTVLVGARVGCVPGMGMG